MKRTANAQVTGEARREDMDSVLFAVRDSASMLSWLLVPLGAACCLWRVAAARGEEGGRSDLGVRVERKHIGR